MIAYIKRALKRCATYDASIVGPTIGGSFKRGLWVKERIPKEIYNNKMCSLSPAGVRTSLRTDCSYSDQKH